MNPEIRKLYENSDMGRAEEGSGLTKKKKKGEGGKKGSKKRMKYGFKSLSKQMKKMNKQQKTIRRAFETFAASETKTVEGAKKVEQVEHGENMGKGVSAEKSFWGKLGDAIIKAVPTILATVVTSICSFFFKRKQGNDNFRQHWAMA